MLIIANRMSELCFSQLMHVYREGNIENGAMRYPHLPPYQQEAAAEQDFYQYLNEIFFSQSDSFYALWQVQGRYAAALRMEPYCDGLLLSALETAPDLRHRGYATELIRSVIEYLQTYGSGTIYSHVSKRNTLSLRTHQKCGFAVIADHARYADGSVLRNSVTLQCTY